MFHIESLWDDEGDLALYEMGLRDQYNQARDGACEDDVEARCPYVNLLPEESGKEGGSPLKIK